MATTIQPLCDRCGRNRRRPATELVECYYRCVDCPHPQCEECAEWTHNEAMED
jgi:hypothetical protein